MVRTRRKNYDYPIPASPTGEAKPPSVFSSSISKADTLIPVPVQGTNTQSHNEGSTKTHQSFSNPVYEEHESTTPANSAPTNIEGRTVSPSVSQIGWIENITNRLSNLTLGRNAQNEKKQKAKQE